MRNKDKRPEKGRDKRQGKPRPQGSSAAPRTGPVRPARVAAPVGNARPDEVAPQRALMERQGPRPSERIPVILQSSGAGDFHLIDSGNALKLEQYGPYRIVRPEA
ncbi:MAG: class I SAM-dependent rRNA methyltransferase, partial [Pseudorhizobium sp.]